jgi:site-specific DNA-adenine methylase
LNIETHRGIRTNPTPRFEDEPVTITNRLGLKSFSLPRIDDKKRFAGYPGITGISRKLARIIPDCDIFCEPLAGSAKVFQAILQQNTHKINQFVLNDKSKFITKWLKREFKFDDVKITSTDFAYCIKKYDSKSTVFVIDQPWFQSFYDQSFSYFDKENVAAYDREILELCKSIKGKFFITTRRENTRMKNSGFRNLFIQSEYVVMGKYPRVLITTNVSGEDLK